MPKVQLDEIQRRLIREIADLHDIPVGAYNFRANSKLAGRNTTANIDITSKEDKSGIDIRVKPGTKNESVHIPVVISDTGINETVYNDFYIGEDADVLIVAGCGIDNCGSQNSEHDGVHRFFLEKGAHVRYVEKHYGSGDGTGQRILNPVTEAYLEEGASMEMEMEQIKGVDSLPIRSIWMRKVRTEMSYPVPSQETIPIRSSMRRSQVMRLVMVIQNAIPSSWTTDASWRFPDWKPMILMPNFSMRQRSERSRETS